MGKPLACRVLGHDWSFGAEGRVVAWACARCGAEGGRKALRLRRRARSASPRPSTGARAAPRRCWRPWADASTGPGAAADGVAGHDARAPLPTARLDLEYDGGAFAGWARQPGRRTVQGELERALARARPRARRPGRRRAHGPGRPRVAPGRLLPGAAGVPAVAQRAAAPRRRRARLHRRARRLRRPPRRPRAHLRLPAAPARPSARPSSAAARCGGPRAPIVTRCEACAAAAAGLPRLHRLHADADRPHPLPARGLRGGLGGARATTSWRSGSRPTRSCGT